MSQETELSAKMTLTFMPNGVMVLTEHPEQGSNPATNTHRVYMDADKLGEVVKTAFEEYCIYAGLDKS